MFLTSKQVWSTGNEVEADCTEPTAVHIGVTVSGGNDAAVAMLTNAMKAEA